MSTGITYYPGLIDELKQDHREILGVFGEMCHTAKAQDAVGFKDQLALFKRQLVAHLLKEAVKLYIYMRQKMRDDETTYGLATAYKKEMDGIGRVAMGFVDSYTAIQPDQIDFAQLNASLREIGQVLGDRIRREELELYPLYHDDY